MACLVLSTHLYANTFIVTSNANRGAGTLRDAIEKAAANGSGVTDTIFFNLPDVSRTGRTILVDSSLPDLSSHIYIDGTSQPGTPFGISDARVEIRSVTPYFSLFIAFRITGVEIYGLYLKGIYTGSALYFGETNDVQFGKSGKGNMVTGFGQAFYTNIQDPADPASSNLSFQGNIMGTDESGDKADFFTYNYHTFYLRNVRNVTIGGVGNGEGNLMCDQTMMLELFYTKPDSAGYLKIQGNKIGTDRTGLKVLTSFRTGDVNISGYNDGSDYFEGTTDADVEITNNISTGRFQLFKIKNYFKVKGNKLGVGADNVTNISYNSAYTLFFLYCGQGIIGGSASADKNYIAYGEQGVGQFHCGSITISRNSFFCHASEGIGYYNWAYYTRPKPFITINSLSSTYVAGTALPNSTVELFYDDNCPLCEGKTYLTTVLPDQMGTGNIAEVLAVPL